ncbi:MAG: D-TA family PLP-dependent enzyme [Flavobacteriaceae bacterium]
MSQNWYTLDKTADVISPSLLVYPDRIEKNIQHMIAVAGDIGKLRPHIKTHKTAEIVKMQMAHGIHKFKCATITEADLLGSCKARDVLLAMQPVGANVDRFFNLIERYPKTEFSTIVDSELCVEIIGKKAEEKQIRVGLFLDLNTGMNRTGIVPNISALNLYKLIEAHPFLIARGLHAYDGHIRNTDLKERKLACDQAFEKVGELKQLIEGKGGRVDTIIAGGSPSFPIHASRAKVEVSPGTSLLWDERYGTLFPEMGFIPAAALFTRIVSRPEPNLACLDIGHKAIAPEMNFPRVKIFGMEQAEQIGQSEEHLVVKFSENRDFKVGDVHYAIPMHICPTVAKYPKLLTVKNGTITGSWEVVARDH